MIQRAVNNRWLTSELKPIAIEAIRDGLLSDNLRTRMRASEIVLSMEAQNQRDEHKALDEFSNRVLELASRFGIDVASIGNLEASEVAAGRGDASSTESVEE